MTAPSLDDSLAKLDRLIATRRTQLKAAVTKGHLTVEAAAGHDQDMSVLRARVSWFFERAPEIRALATEIEHRRILRLAEATLREHPAVAPVLDAFPDAAITDVRTLTPPDHTSGATS